MAPFNSSSSEMEQFYQYVIERGLFLYTHWNTVLLIPPLIITKDQLNEGFDILDAALQITDQGVSG
jgi:taurine--2-oxoglutarate transaminase